MHSGFLGGVLRPAVKKYDFELVYTKAVLEKWRDATKLEDYGESAYLSRCSYSDSVGRVTCDRYKADRIEVDPNGKIKKYYVFRSQFNLQLFRNLSSIEDNGIGGIPYLKVD